MQTPTTSSISWIQVKEPLVLYQLKESCTKGNQYDKKKNGNEKEHGLIRILLDLLRATFSSTKG
jgi:hypothetical protein